MNLPSNMFDQWSRSQLLEWWIAHNQPGNSFQSWLSSINRNDLVE